MDWRQVRCTGHQLIDLILERTSQIRRSRASTPRIPTRDDGGHAAGPDPELCRDRRLHELPGHAVRGTDGTPGRRPAGHASRIHIPAIPSAYPAMPVEVTAQSRCGQTIQDLLQETVIQSTVRQLGGQGLGAIAVWMAQLYLLISVPFENLVPNAGLLPPETIGFLYLDTNWLAALVEGALSIGIESSRRRILSGPNEGPDLEHDPRRGTGGPGQSAPQPAAAGGARLPGPDLRG